MAGWAKVPTTGILGDGMSGREGARRTRTRRFTRWLERTLLGAAMMMVVRVVERRLLRAMERRGS
jgi:hypothetical protein